MVRQPLTPKRVTVEVEKLSTPKKLATPKKEKPRTPKKEQLSPKKEEHHYDENSGLDHNDPSKPSHRLTNGPEPSKTIESDGSNIKKPS